MESSLSDFLDGAWSGGVGCDDAPVVVSLFSGCGGLDLGFEMAGFDVALAADNWEPAVETYRDNFSTPVVTKDLSGLSVDAFRRRLRDAGYTSSAVDVVVGGPPCQGFSRLNNNQIALGSMDDDERNTLFQSFVRLASSLDPSVIVMENVRDLVTREMDDGTEVTDAIESVFADAGYEVEYRVLNAAEYGVPQKRRRVVFVGYDDSVDSFVWPEEVDVTVTSSDALQSMSDSLPNMDYANTSERVLEKIRHVPPGGYYADLPDEYKTRDEDGNIVKRYGTYLRRLDPEKPALTVNSNTFIHPEEDRYLTPREMARLQTFPDYFEFAGTKRDVLQQIGNAVPVLLASRLGRCVYNCLG